MIGGDDPSDAAYVDTMLVISVVAVMLEAENWLHGPAPDDISQPSELAAAVSFVNMRACMHPASGKVYRSGCDVRPHLPAHSCCTFIAPAAHGMQCMARSASAAGDHRSCPKLNVGMPIPAQAIAALAFLVSHSRCASPKKDEAVAALTARVARVFSRDDVLLPAEVLAPGCAVEVARAALRGSEQGRSRAAVSPAMPPSPARGSTSSKVLPCFPAAAACFRM